MLVQSLFPLLFLSLVSYVYGNIRITSPSGGTLEVGVSVSIIWEDIGGQPTPNFISLQLYQGDDTSRQPVTTIVSPIKSSIGQYDWLIPSHVEEGNNYSVGALVASATVFSRLFSIINPNSSIRDLVHPKNQATDIFSGNSSGVQETNNVNPSAANNHPPMRSNSGATTATTTIMGAVPKLCQLLIISLAAYSTN
ncbi:hypothetical protein K493DRAFT_300941 [Basidiobolus meristosporus CBS 931.73]|uniref:Yeast cell wall synthesis Kre9/Knh1-like N-terminal domain-containing protein n=1 Tax=Basidiobolus meristosporus CBS 931.73 TaxID=1314790 RepID=A0A1Y1YEE8_9FUNG|nr:hypothetical protein K493DRAFT_300941 [Basidiobolus meristosporus CBS 931.73]|eukprot:ORX96421.1 hypothetical protein K493DRAFT_300941 [Basidiobolus meristosporus CBS 931.73]